MAAQAAVGFIKQGCAMLHEGRMELEGAKKTVEGVMADVKAIRGIFDWFIGLFGGKHKSQPSPAKPVAQKKAKAVAAQIKKILPKLQIKVQAFGSKINSKCNAQKNKCALVQAS